MRQEILTGIYQIKNTKSNKVYVGSSSHIQKRWTRHVRDLRYKRHHSIYLQRAWDSGDSSDFELSILEVVLDPEVLIEKEQYWMDALNSYIPEFGYNMEKNAGKRRDYTITEETRAKMSASRKGRPAYNMTDEIREKIRQSNTGKKQSSETVQKRVNKTKGRKFSSEQLTAFRESLNTRSREGYKMTWDSVREVRRLSAEGKTNQELSEIFNVDRKNIWCIVNNRTWKE